MPSFLPLMVQPSPSEKSSWAIALTVPLLLPGLAQLDEHGVLGEAAGVDHQRLAEAGQQVAVGAQVRQRHRLAAAGVVGDGDHAEGDAVGLLAQQRLDAVQVDVPLEGVAGARLAPLGDDQVERLDAAVLQVGAGGVEVGVAGDDLAAPRGHREEDALGGPPLVGGDDVLVAGQVADHRLEPVEAARPGVALVPLHDAGPLPRRHGPGAGVGEEVEEHVVGAQREDVEPGRLQQPRPLLAGGHADGLDHLDAERLDHGAGHGGSSPGGSGLRSRPGREPPHPASLV